MSPLPCTTTRSFATVLAKLTASCNVLPLLLAAVATRTLEHAGYSMIMKLPTQLPSPEIVTVIDPADAAAEPRKTKLAIPTRRPSPVCASSVQDPLMLSLQVTPGMPPEWLSAPMCAMSVWPAPTALVKVRASVPLIDPWELFC